MPIASKPECVDGPRQQLTTRRSLRECLLQANPSVLMAHDGPRQQLTTRRRLRECLFQANPSVLMAHANNSQQEGD